MKIKDKLLSLAGIACVIVGYFIGLVLISLPLNNFFTPVLIALIIFLIIMSRKYKKI